jgi:two-component system sensor histidine kinase RpfC
MDYKLEEHNYKLIKNKPLSILIVDDDDDTVESLRLILLSEGHSITTVEEGPRCITLCENNIYDIIFMDYHLDGLNGDTIIEIIKNHSMNTSRIFAFTGDKTEQCIQTFSTLGIDGILFKPTDPELILTLVNSLYKTPNIDPLVINDIMNESNGSILLFQKIENSSIC